LVDAASRRYVIPSWREETVVRRYVLITSAAAILIGGAACTETAARQATSPDGDSTRSPTVLPSSQVTPSALVRLARAEKHYAAVLAKYQQLYDDPTTLSDAFRLLAQVERRFDTWRRAIRVASQQHVIDVSPTTLREWGRTFEAWLDNQGSQQLAVENCAGGEKITELTLIRCLDTLGPLVHRAARLSRTLNRLIASDAALSSVLPDMRF
jgi:hypothetical protein